MKYRCLIRLNETWTLRHSFDDNSFETLEEAISFYTKKYPNTPIELWVDNEFKWMNEKNRAILNKNQYELWR